MTAAPSSQRVWQEFSLPPRWHGRGAPGRMMSAAACHRGPDATPHYLEILWPSPCLSFTLYRSTVSSVAHAISYGPSPAGNRNMLEISESQGKGTTASPPASLQPTQLAAAAPPAAAPNTTTTTPLLKSALRDNCSVLGAAGRLKYFSSCGDDHVSLQIHVSFLSNTLHPWITSLFYTT